ncbi:MAG TPA: hypothetical protein VKA86_17615 [Candidatus Krumholzibacteria bacterium]|nr:hypothetical protein [Candidatus Krumholzibacteria bacterium]
MEPIDYEAEYERLRDEIEQLPPEQREALRALHAESVERHEQIQRARTQNEEALTALRLRLQEMADGFHRLDTAVADLRLVTKMALFEYEARQRESRGGGTEPPVDDA